MDSDKQTTAGRMLNLPETLRALADRDVSERTMLYAVMREAAGEIEMLRARIRELEATE